ncbi:histone acetyltransferase subunit NuA4-domain-containing protein [Mycena floridula]|nr:histone acetyltransferase subunit NuA4-domain-containing protein [Mycena floridula]
MAEDDKARYEALKRDLMSAIPKKRALDKQLAQIEVQIYNLEANYLNETAVHSGGNIIQGYENYLKQSITRKRYEITEQDRVFSNSSLTTQRSLDLMGEGEETTGTSDEYAKQPTPGVTTVIVPPATRGQELTAAQQNKLTRDKEYQRRKRAATNRSSRIGSTGSLSEDEVIPTSSRRSTKRKHDDD